MLFGRPGLLSFLLQYFVVSISSKEDHYIDLESSAALRHRNLLLSDPKTVVAKPSTLTFENYCSDFVNSPVFRLDRIESEENVTPRPFWVPAYPGSGSEMFRILIKAVTGGAYRGEDIYTRLCHEGYVATCKTHFPAYALDFGELDPLEDPRHNPASEKFQRSILFLIRNPYNALSSYANFIYEKTNRDKLSPHSTQMPETEWLQWRDDNFLREIKSWCNQIMYWLTVPQIEKHYGGVNFIQYEKLSSPETGPGLLEEISEIISQEGRIRVVSAKAIPCTWFRVVVDQQNFFSGNSENDRSGKIEEGKTKRLTKYVPSYSDQQKTIIDAELENLSSQIIGNFPQESALVEILRSYQVSSVSF